MIPQISPTDNDYTNRELDSKFGSLHEKLDSILHQVIKTNGRVTSLEAWRNYVLGFCAAISILLIPIFFRVFDKAI